MPSNKKMEEKANAILPNFCFRNSKKSSAIFYVLTPQKSKKFENQTGSVLLESTPPPFFNFFISDLILLKNHQFHFEFLEYFQSYFLSSLSLPFVLLIAPFCPLFFLLFLLLKSILSLLSQALKRSF